MRLIRGRRELLSGILSKYTDRDACTCQLVELQKQVPSLYALLSVNACALALTHYALAPAWLTVALPGGMIGLCALRAVHWWRLRPQDISGPEALKRLRGTTILTVLFSAFFVVWAMMLNGYGGPFEQGHVAIFVAITVIACIFCLTHLPAAALLVTVIVIGGFSIHCFATGNDVFIAIALNTAFVAVVMVRILVNNFLAFLQLIASKAEAQRLSAENERLAHTDSLTGLPNRRYFFQRLDALIAAASGRPAAFALAIFDLDRFKPINDSLGHAAGDRMLKEMATRLLGCVAEDDTVARMGGDEFTLLLQPRVSREMALNRAIHVAEQILASLVKPFVLEGREFFVTASIGIALSPQDGNELSQLMKNADTAMYHAKERGKNNFQFYQADMNASALERLELESDLRHALDQNEFVLYYQPQFSGDGKRLTGAEALLRWRHPRRGLVPPGDFIPVLEELGLVVDVGDWVISEACRQLKTWHQNKVRVPKVSVNISARQFSDGQLGTRIATILKDTGLPPACLELELTESILMREVNEAMHILDSLKNLGLSIAVDDFGTGYSSLNYLKQFPIDVLKIDRTFVDGLPSGEQDAQIARAIIAMAHSLNLAVIAEGVETHEQLDFLREHGCDEVQGYLFGRPMPANRFEAQFSNDALFMFD